MVTDVAFSSLDDGSQHTYYCRTHTLLVIVAISRSVLREYMDVIAYLRFMIIVVDMYIVHSTTAFNITIYFYKPTDNTSCMLLIRRN